MLTIIAAMALAVFTGLLVVIAVRQYRLSRADFTDAHLQRAVKTAISEANEPLKEAVTECTSQLNHHESTLKELTDTVAFLGREVSRLNVKVEPYWNSVLRRNNGVDGEH